MPRQESGAVAGRSHPTMRDAAPIAGLAITTVSRVVNRAQTVGPALVAQERATADKFGYRLNRTDGRTATIGILAEILLREPRCA